MNQLYKKTENADLRSKSSIVFDYSIISALLIVILAFGFSDGAFEEKKILDDTNDITEVINIPPTEQLSREPEPSKPEIPIEAEDEDEIDDITIDDTVVDVMETYSDIEEPEDEDEPLEYFAVSVKPTIKKAVKPEYPRLARKANIEALVTVQVTIDKNGLPTDVKILRGHDMLNVAALEAAKKHVFTPAMQGDKPVPVKWNLPFNFRLRN